MKDTRRLHKYKDEGYTLIEMVTVAAVLMFVLAAALPFLYTQLNQSARTQSRIESVQQARNALREMARELRQADQLVYEVGRLTTSGRLQGGSYNDEISFVTDRDYSGSINPCTDPSLPPECVTYSRSFAGFGLDIMRGRNNTAGEKVATNVTNLKFTYFGNCPRRDANGDGWVYNKPGLTEWSLPTTPGVYADLPLVSLVLIEMKVRTQDQEITLNQEVSLRNLNAVANNTTC